MTCLEVSQRYKLDRSLLNRRMNQHGYKKRLAYSQAWDRRKQGPKHTRWKRVDWKQPDSKIARAMGVSRQSVYNQRKKRVDKTPVTV